MNQMNPSNPLSLTDYSNFTTESRNRLNLDAKALLNKPSQISGKGFEDLNIERMKGILAQLSSNMDPSSLATQKQVLDDTARAQKIQLFVEQTNAQMEAMKLQTMFKISEKWLSIA